MCIITHSFKSCRNSFAFSLSSWNIAGDSFIMLSASEPAVARKGGREALKQYPTPKQIQKYTNIIIMRQQKIQLHNIT